MMSFNNADGRVKCRFGFLQVGQVFDRDDDGTQKRVTSLGKSWWQSNDDETMYGIYGTIDPWDDGCHVQYAYYVVEPITATAEVA